MIAREEAEQIALKLMDDMGMNTPKTALFVVRLLGEIYEEEDTDGNEHTAVSVLHTSG